MAKNVFRNLKQEIGFLKTHESRLIMELIFMIVKQLATSAIRLIVHGVLGQFEVTH